MPKLIPSIEDEIEHDIGKEQEDDLEEYDEDTDWKPEFMDDDEIEWANTG